jgi:hypothetical protein
MRQLFKAFEYSDLRTADDICEFLQNCRFALRKPPFYPLNYGNSDNCDFRFSTGNCKQQTMQSTRKGLRDGTEELVLRQAGNNLVEM